MYMHYTTKSSANNVKAFIHPIATLKRFALK